MGERKWNGVGFLMPPMLMMGPCSRDLLEVSERCSSWYLRSGLLPPASLTSFTVRGDASRVH